MDQKASIALPIVCEERNDTNFGVINFESIINECNCSKKICYKLIHPITSYSPASPKFSKASGFEMKLAKGSEHSWTQGYKKTLSTDKSTDSSFSKFAIDTSLSLENPFSPRSDCHLLDTEARVENLNFRQQSLKRAPIKPKIFLPTLLKLDMGDLETQKEISKNYSNVNAITPLKWFKIEDVTKNEINSSNTQLLSQ